MNRQLRRRVRWQPSAAWPSRPKFGATDATGPLPFSNASFDAITCIDAINHFPDRPRLIAEWARLLRPGGRLLFTDPITLTGPLTNAEMAYEVRQVFISSFPAAMTNASLRSA